MADSAPSDIEQLKADVNQFFLVISTALVFFMQCGFVMLSVGSVRAKNAKNIVLKILLDATVGGLCFYLLGYAFAYGDKEDGHNGFIGYHNFALRSLPRDKYQFWVFQYAFAATSATIVSGAVAERTKFEAYLLYSVVLVSWVYPVIVHWQWSAYGWLSAFKVDGLFAGSGALDFAGCGPVHMIGGLAGLAGAKVVGPRLGRYDAKGNVNEIPGHNASLMLLGCFILWFGWYGFNPGSALAVTDGMSAAVTNAALTTTLSGIAGCIASFFFQMVVTYIKEGHVVWDVIIAGNGALAGLVGITASCAFVRPWSAVVIGLIAGLLYPNASYLVSHVLRVDDPLDAIAVHLFCGMWGLIASAAFADKLLLETAFGIRPDRVVETTRNYGFVVGGNGAILAANLVLIVVIIVWTLVWMTPLFLVLKYMGLLRVAQDEEVQGLDVSHHGGSAYPQDTSVMEGSMRSQAKAIDTMKQEMAVLKRELGNLRQRDRHLGEQVATTEDGNGTA